MYTMHCFFSFQRWCYWPGWLSGHANVTERASVGHGYPATRDIKSFLFSQYLELCISLPRLLDKRPQLCGLEQQKCIVSQFWWPDVWNHGVSIAMLPHTALRKELLVASDVSWLIDASLKILCLSHYHLFPFFTWISFCAFLSLCPNFSFLYRCQSHWFRAHPNKLILT